MAKNNLKITLTQAIEAALKKLMGKKSFTGRCEKGHPGILTTVTVTAHAEWKGQKDVESKKYQIMTAYNVHEKKHYVYLSDNEESEDWTFMCYQFERFNWMFVNTAMTIIGDDHERTLTERMAKNTGFHEAIINEVMEIDYELTEPCDVISHHTCEQFYALRKGFVSEYFVIYPAQQRNIPERPEIEQFAA